MKCNYIRYSSSEISTKRTANSQTNINIPRKDSVKTVLSSYLEANFDILNAATDNRYVDANDITLVNVGPIALFSIYKLATNSGKVLEEISHGYIICLMYKLITSSRRSDDLSIGFDRNRDRRERELTDNGNQEGKYHVRTYLKDIFGFAETCQKATYGLG